MSDGSLNVFVLFMLRKTLWWCWKGGKIVGTCLDQDGVKLTGQYIKLYIIIAHAQQVSRSVFRNITNL